MRKKWTFFIALILVAGLAGCSNGESDTAASNAVLMERADEPASSEPAASDPAVTVSAAAAPTPTAAPAPDTEAIQQPLYRLNEVYRFVPIRDDVPDKAVLLTFDDGPKDEAIIESLMDTLDKHNAKAIFFVNGYRVKQNPELLKLIFERGGTIGNHSYDHINLKNEEASVVEEQIGSVQTAVEELTGARPKFFRPPFGAGDEAVKEVAKKHGLLYMTWSNGSLDWDSSARDKPEVVVKNVMEQLHPGANILMHELQWTADALDELLSKIEAEGYVFIDPATIETVE
ncbi:polysaccharide deacetylase family protein [Paenibacillus nanensis]|uniref:Polysaccharide deacetylase family protein n=1 Tax=Paenibacillus nanensis TaxID=393251 RepID=A0A3A1UY39_9BACL|nr:polysaccharide deacetylase family protein [Paenibacillus nanensis]RIX53457.1 polysaccharide deacetylase family protein [Paenibacillus nanensis]